jgi:hypothetical protein
VLPQKGCRTKKILKTPCGEVFSEQLFGSNPSTLTFLSSIKHHCRKKKGKKRTSERFNQGNSSLKAGEEGIIHNVQSGLVAYLYHQYKYSQSSRLL